MNEKELIEKWSKISQNGLAWGMIEDIIKESFKAGQESNDCIICNEKDDNMSCQLCIGKQIKKSQQEERERIVKIIKPIIILLNRIEKARLKPYLEQRRLR